MRTRTLATLSAFVVSAFLLSGCTSTTEPEASPTSAGAAELCSAMVASGSAIDSVTVDGEFGDVSTLAFEAPLEVSALQASVISEGSGDVPGAGDLVSYALSAYDADTGELLGEFGYGDSPVLPAQISPDNPLGQFFGCAPVGTRVVAASPATDASPGVVYILDLLDIVPSAAWGEPQEPVDGMPTVDLAADGAPTVTLTGDKPTEFTKATLKKGDGAVVAEGDAVLVQYHGVSWDTGEVFDESWGGSPFQFTAGSGVVEGFSAAVLGETVGSQVIAILPPSVAYGEGDINDSDLTGQTLVFVVDILAAQPAA